MSPLNKLKVLILIALAASLFVSCKKDKSSDPLITADLIVGQYKIKSVSWEGAPVDLDGDGVASKDLNVELMSLPFNQNANNFHASVGNSYDRGRISFFIPIQGYEKEYDGSYPEGLMIGGDWPINLSYKINSKGEVLIDHLDQIDLGEFDSRIELSNIKNGIAFFDFQEHLSFRAEYTLYDRLTKQFVEGVIQYTFERIQE